MRIDFTIRNRGDAPVVLCDRMRSTKGPTDLAVSPPAQKLVRGDVQRLP